MKEMILESKIKVELILVNIVEEYIYAIVKKYYKNGRLSKEHTTRYGLPHGEYRLYYPDGALRYLGFFEDGKMEGWVQAWYNSGQMHSYQYYKNDKAEGWYFAYYENGQPNFQVQYVNGSKEGETKEWWPNGQLRAYGYYKNNLTHGDYHEWFDENGDTYVWMQFENGKQYKQQKYFQGKLVELIYLKDDKKHGKYKRWNADGELVEDCIYENGEVVQHI